MELEFAGNLSASGNQRFGAICHFFGHLIGGDNLSMHSGAPILELLTSMKFAGLLPMTANEAAEADLFLSELGPTWQN